ncbi:MAG: peptidoglycan binding domain-containing protein, partial [Lachnospiraceae bacterium]|nr:peptidoglycan binding domain-containing protein [Lachnospiraceae bacterium]
MKRVSFAVPAALVAAALIVMPVQARDEKIESGIYVEDIDLSGMTKDQARQAIEDYVAGFGGAQITLHVNDAGEIATTAAELGLRWGNDEILEEATNFGRDGDILSCYKELKDLEYKNKVYRVCFDFDKAKLRSMIEENAGQYNQEAVNATLQKTEEGF